MRKSQSVNLGNPHADMVSFKTNFTLSSFAKMFDDTRGLE